MNDSSKGLSIQHFDSKTKQSLPIKETFKNTIAQYLFPEVDFSLGVVYDSTIPEDLQSIEGKTLQFTNGKKFYFANDEVRKLVFPLPSDGVAYGSLPFTPNLSFSEIKQARILVIDDETGANGIGLDPLEAKKLVGDCFGRIDSQLHSQIGGLEQTPFQFRLGSKAQENDPSYRLAKGTLSPAQLSNIGDGYDLILPKSAFKGRKGLENGEIQLGEKTLNVGLGIKTHGYYGEHSLGPQFLVNFPQAVEADILPRLKVRLEQLNAIAQDPIKIAQDYLQVTDKRYQYQLRQETDFLDQFSELSPGDLEAMVTTAAREENQEMMYHLIKGDVHYQLLEHPKITAVLNHHLQNQYRELATGRFIKFKGALLQPSLELEPEQFCDPNLPDGAKVIVTRSPILNSNGIITLTNKHLPQLMDYEGVAWMNPTSAAQHLQGDFDGDRVAYALADDFPTLAAEVERKNQPLNRYAPVVKKEKIPYQGSFESIALERKNNQIGLIANQVMKTIALEAETTMLPPQQRDIYLNQLANHYQKILHFGKFTIPPSLAKLHPQIEQLAQRPRDNLSSEEKLEIARDLLHQIVGELGNELQIAADGPKSALRPDQDILNCTKQLTNYTQVGWLQNYKDRDIYLERPLTSSNYSPIDLMVQPVNEAFTQQTLQPRPTHQFRNLFSDVSFTEQHLEKAKTIKQQHNELNGYAHQLKEQLEGTATNSGLGMEQLKAAWNQVKEYDQQIIAKIPEAEKLPMAAAMWSVCTTQSKQKEYSYQKGSAAFAIFGEEINQRLKTLQFQKLTISGIRSESNEHLNRVFRGETLPIKVALETNRESEYYNKRVVLVEQKVLGHFSNESPQLPVGTKAKATITNPPGAGITATREDGKPLRIGVLKNYHYSQQDFQGLEATLEIAFQPGKKHWHSPIAIAKLQGKILGEIKDKATKQLLQQEGLLHAGQKIKVTLYRDSPSIALLQVDPNSVEYPQTFSPHKEDKAVQLYQETNQGKMPNNDLLPPPPPLAPEFKIMNLEVQQQRTEQVAPIISAFLHSQQSNHVVGRDHTASWDGTHLSLSDNAHQKPKMIATYEQEKEKWIAQPLPAQSPGLSAKDVEHFESLVPQIKRTLLKNKQQSSHELVS